MIHIPCLWTHHTSTLNDLLLYRRYRERRWPTTDHPLCGLEAGERGVAAVVLVTCMVSLVTSICHILSRFWTSLAHFLVITHSLTTYAYFTPSHDTPYHKLFCHDTPYQKVRICTISQSLTYHTLSTTHITSRKGNPLETNHVARFLSSNPIHS